MTTYGNPEPPISLLEHLESLLGEFNREVRAARSGQHHATKHDLEKMEGRIMAKISSLAAQLTAIAAQADKSKAEIVAAVDTLTKKVSDLEALLDDADTTPEIDAALEAVKTAVQAVDDLNPDATPA